MTGEQIKDISRRHGFERVFFTALRRFDLGANEYGLLEDAVSEFPWASCMGVFVYPYKPFNRNERISSYYLASNRAYHAFKALLDELAANGLRAQRAYIPVKLQLEAEGLARMGLHSLVSIEPYGTRVILLTAALEGVAADAVHTPAAAQCGGCGRCIEACPAGAITEKGLDPHICLRYHMDSAKHPDYVRDLQRNYMGCELCQFACPLNAALEQAEPDEETREAFDMLRLIKGDTARARSLAGRNLTGGGKLTAEAIAFAAQDGLYAEEIAACADSGFEAVRDAVRYARQRLDGASGRRPEL